VSICSFLLIHLGFANRGNDRFGTVALILQLVPPLSMVFLMSTAVGSALWAVDLENKRDQIEGRRPDPVGDYHDEDTI
jgi:hypothetical protein